MHFLERKAHITSDFVQFMLAPLGTDKTFDVHGFTVKNLMSGMPVVDWSQAVDAYPHLRGADIPRLKCGDRIQILLGVEYAELMTRTRSCEVRLALVPLLRSSLTLVGHFPVAQVRSALDIPLVSLTIL